MVTNLAAMVRCLELALGSEVEDFVSVFVDDILVISKPFEEHLKHLDIVFSKLPQVNLVLNYKKCKFVKFQIKFLGYVISAQDVSTDPEKIQSITGFSTPKKAKDIREFLRLTGYHRRFKPDYAKTIQPLLKLLRKNTKWRWKVRHENAFKAAKDLFTKNLHVFHPKKEGTYVLNCDACLLYTSRCV